MIFSQENRLYSFWTRYKYVPLPWKVLPIVLFIAGIFSLDRHWIATVSISVEVLHRLYYLPIILSGLLFGIWGGFFSASIVSLLFIPHWIGGSLPPANHFGSWEEIVLFYAFGLLIGLLVDRERIETQRRQDQEHLAVLGEAAATVAHELKNPVITIGANILRMQKKAEPGDPIHARLGLIYQECQRVELLLKDMVNFARPIDLNFEPTDINALVRKVIEMVIPQAEKNQVEFSANLDGNLPLVLTDQTRMTQVFYNLNMNAVQASMPEQRILIRTEKKKSQISVEFADTGCGIPPDLQLKIFTPFFSTKKDGSGMGLAVSKRIVELHQGKLFCQSNPSKGTVFAVFLPIKKG
ncbi:MAG TPA: ATP-binding protein [Thermodesulfobacteriota bacterium]|nr:ATP-binding protein [Thermodesulfobacteriota bacterium]